MPKAIVIAGTSSGCGKTSVTLGLMKAFARKGMVVQGFKSGPDFIDPGLHRMASGLPSHNLDGWMLSADEIHRIFRRNHEGCDISIIEGAMGLFDGIGAVSEEGSAAQLAKILGVPVMLVVNARGMARSAAALVKGYAEFDPDLRLDSVLFNMTGSPAHGQILAQALEGQSVRVLGSLPRVPNLELPSRHLGLVTATEHGDRAQAAVAAMTELVARHVDVDAVWSLAHSAVSARPWSPEEAVGEPVTGSPVVAMAAGSAFTFGYAEHTELLAAAGAEVRNFDPLSQTLPERTAALVLPGGFPEQYPEQLSANAEVREQIRVLAAAVPVHAECGGLTYLMDDLDGHRMCGVLAGSATFSPRLTLGYRDAVAPADSPLYRCGERVSGHEFHRTRVEFAETVQPAWMMRQAGAGATGPLRDGVLQRGVHASYLHTHPAAHPVAIRRFVEQAAGRR